MPVPAGALLVGGRSRRLDALTLKELRARLELRRARWPASANPYLLVNQSTATTAIRYCLELGPLDQASEPVLGP